MEYWQKLRQAMGHETIILPAAAGAIIKEDKILIVRSNSMKKWQIPGGLYEPTESIQETVCREVKEELGLTMTAGKLISVYSGSQWINTYPNGDKVKQLIFFFKMEGDIDEIELQISELSEYRFITQDEIPEEIMSCCKQKILDYFAYQDTTIFR